MANNKLQILIKTLLDRKGATESISLMDRLKNKAGELKAKLDKTWNSKGAQTFRRIIIGITAALAGSVVEAAKFNIQMARVWTMAGGGIKTFTGLRKQARGLASDFGVARSSVAKGMYNALSAGIDKSKLSSVMKTAAKVAVADGSDISVAIDGITTILNSFKMEADDAEDVADQLFQTVALGKTTFGELASTLATVAPMAASSNIPLQQILAHVATLTASGTPTAQAMTQIRASIQGLNKALGDGWSANMSYQDALKAVWTQAGHSQTKLLEMVGSTEAVQGVLGGVGRNAGIAADKLSSMATSAGAAQEAFDKVDQFRHWPKAIESARGLLERMGQEIDQRLAPGVKDITEWMNKIRDDDSLWNQFGTFLDTKIAQIKSLYDYLQNGGDISTLATAAGLILKGHIKNGFQKAISLLVAEMPRLGEALATSATGALGNWLGDKVEATAATRQQLFGDTRIPSWKEERSPEYQSLYAENLQQARLNRLDLASAQYQGEVGSGLGDADIAQGREVFESATSSTPPQPSSQPAAVFQVTMEDGTVAESFEEWQRLIAERNAQTAESLDSMGTAITEGAEETATAMEELSTAAEESAKAQTESATQSAEALSSLTESVTTHQQQIQQAGTTVATALQSAGTTLTQQQQQAQQLLSISEQNMAVSSMLADRTAQLAHDIDGIRRSLASMRV